MLKQEQDSLKKLLQRIFPDIKVTEKSHDRWMSTFEEKVTIAISELRKDISDESRQELEKQNKSLQGLVSHYKEIIDDTVSIFSYTQTKDNRTIHFKKL